MDIETSDQSNKPQCLVKQSHSSHARKQLLKFSDFILSGLYEMSSSTFSMYSILEVYNICRILDTTQILSIVSNFNLIWPRKKEFQIPFALLPMERLSLSSLKLNLAQNPVSKLIQIFI